MSVQRRPRTGKPATGTVKWVVRYRDPSGREHSKSFRTEKDAKAFDQEQQRALRRREWIDPTDGSMPLADLVRSEINRSRTLSTRDTRRMLLKNLGDLGGVPVGRLRPSDIESWLVLLTDGRPWQDGKALAPSTVQTLAASLHGMLTRAVLDDLIVRHPMRGVKIRLTRTGIQRTDIPSEQDVAALIRVAETCAVGRSSDPMMAGIIRLASETGLRSGEVCGLRVRSVDFLRRELYVTEQTCQRTGELRELKTDAARRVVPLAETTVEMLAEHLRRFPRDREETIFARSTGRPLTSGDIGSRFRRIAVLAGVDTTFHALRHFYASRLIAAGVPVNVVQRVLGHADPAMTLRVYTHLWPGSDDVVRDVVDSVRDFCGMDGAGPSAGGSVSAG